MNRAQIVKHKYVLDMLLFAVTLVALISFIPTSYAYQPTPPPNFDQSGRSVSNLSSTYFSAEGLFCGSCYNSLILPSDLNPMVVLSLSFGSSYARNARFENLFDHPVLLRYSEKYYSAAYEYVMIPAHSMSPMIWLNPQYFSLSYLTLFNYSISTNKTLNTIWTQNSLSMWSPYDPSGLTHSDFLTITLMKSNCKINLRSERFQLVLADRRQHNSSSNSPPPITDLQFVDCLPRGAIGTGYICPINITGIIDPEDLAQSPMSVANWLWQYYIYELRRYDTFKYMANTTILSAGASHEYMQVSSTQPWITSTLPARFPLQFAPLLNGLSYIPSPRELHQYITTDDGWTDFPQIENDICDGIRSQSPNCYVLYPHSGVRLKGVFSTCPLDIHLCGINSDEAFLPGVVSADGRTVSCTFTQDVWQQFNALEEVSISLTYFPADRGYHSLEDEATARQELADEAARIAQVTAGDPDKIIETPKMNLMAHSKEDQESQTTKTKPHVSSAHSRLSFAKREKIVSAASLSTSKRRLTSSQMKHPHAEYIMQLIERTARTKPNPFTTTAASSRYSRPTFRSSSTSNDPYAWSAGDFAIPMGGMTFRMSIHPRMFISSSTVGDNPFEVTQKQDSIRYFITSNVCIATGILVCISLFLLLSCALLDRLEDKCPSLRRRMRQMQQQQQQRARPQRAAVAPDAEGGIDLPELPVAVALLSEDGGQDPEGEADVADMNSDEAFARRLQAAEEDTEWMWQIDYSLESKIDKQVRRLMKQQQKLAEKTAKKSKQKNTLASAAAIPTSASFSSSSSSSSSSHRKTSNAAVSGSLGVPLLHSDGGVLESKEDWEAASSSYRPPTIAASVHPQLEDEISSSTYSAM